MTLEAVWNNLISAFLRLTKPCKTSPPANTHLGNSWAATVFGFSPLFNLAIKVEVPAAPQPSLKAQLTKAPY
jgi:hypothetical protein